MRFGQSARTAGSTNACSLVLVLLAAGAPALAQPRPDAVREEALLSACERLTEALLGETESGGKELASVAAERAGLLGRLIESNPEQVLRLAVPENFRATLPSTIRDLVEERIELDGTLEVLVEDRHDGSRVLNFLDLDSGERYSLYSPWRSPDFLTGARVRVKGLRVGEAIAVEPGTMDTERSHGLTTSSTQATAVLPNTFGVQKTVVILVNFSNDTSQPYTVDQARTGYAAADNWYREASYQQTSLAVDVFGWFTMPLSNASCDTDLIRSSAQQKAAAAGVNLSNYLRQVYTFPFNSNCQFAGLGSVGGNPSSAWINGSTNTGILAHELGHNQGLYHSHALSCHPNVLTGTCTVLDYGDVTDAMGGGFGHFNAFQKQRLGWLDYNVSPPITQVQASGTYMIDAYEFPGTVPKALRIPRGATGQSFFVELRRNVGWDQSLYRSGVFVHLVTGSDPDSCDLLDMVPETVTSDDDFLDVGRTFTDPVTGVSIRTNSVTATAASMTVTVPGTPCTHVSPAVSIVPSGSQGVAGGVQSTFTVSVTNGDVSPCTASMFNLQAAVPSGWQLAWSAATLSIAPGATGSSTLQVTSPALAADGVYTISGSATNAASASATAPFALAYMLSNPGGGGAAGFSDNFDRADSTSLGSAWTEVSGDLVISGNRLRNAPGAANHMAVVASVGGATETAEADFTSVDNNLGPRFGIVLRYRDPGNYYLISRQVGGSSRLVISRVVNGVERILATSPIPNPATNVSFHLKGRVTGTTLSLDFNGVNKANVTDTTFATGRVGILIGSSSKTTQYQADNVRASVQ